MGETQEVKSARGPFAHLLAIAVGEAAVADQAELARLGYVCRARLTQIMNLLHLAPDIQEEILHLPVTVHGRDAVTERELRPIAGMLGVGGAESSLAEDGRKVAGLTNDTPNLVSWPDRDKHRNDGSVVRLN